MKKSIVLSLVLATSMGLAACGEKPAEEAANAADAMATEVVDGAENAADASMNAAGDAMANGADAMANGADAMAAGAEAAKDSAVDAAADAMKK